MTFLVPTPSLDALGSPPEPTRWYALHPTVAPPRVLPVTLGVGPWFLCAPSSAQQGLTHGACPCVPSPDQFHCLQDNLVFVVGKLDGLMVVGVHRHNADDVVATALAVEPMKFVYRGR